MSFGVPIGLDMEEKEGGPHLVHGEHQPSVPSRQPESAPSTVHLVVGGAKGGSNAASLCDDLANALGGRPVQLVVCDVRALRQPDLGTVDALARVQLAAQRLGCRVRLDGATKSLRELLALVGLREVVPCGAGSDLEARRQPKRREEARGVQEEGDPTDLTT